MRALFIVAFAWFASTASFAQAPPASEAATAASRDIANIIFEPEFVRAAVAGQIDTFTAGLRQRLLTGPFYQNLTPDHQQAITAYVDTMPAFFFDEVLRVRPYFEREFASLLTARFSPSEVEALAYFYAQPGFRDALTQLLGPTLQGQSPDYAQLSEEQRAAFERAFSAPEAQGAPHHWDVVRAMGDARVAAQTAAEPALQQRMAIGLCAALEDQCPARIRAMTGSN